MPEEIKQEVIQKTQKTLGKYVKKPQLSEKLLKKPPFRFLHDIINAVIKETGFLKGLFSESELNSENVKEKDTKIAFLAKVIDAVKVLTNTDLSVRPTKIIAGLEPTETNLLLQTIASAIEKKIDSSEYVRKLKTGNAPTEKKKVSKKNISDEKLRIKKSTPVSNKEENAKTIKSKERTNSDTPKSTDRSRTKQELNKDKSSRKANKEHKTEREKSKRKSENILPAENEAEAWTELPQNNNKSITPRETTDEVLNQISSNETSKNVAEEIPLGKADLEPENTTEAITAQGDDKKRAPSASRPKSARPKSGETKQGSDLANRPKSTLRPPSVRPSSARPGAPRLRPDSAIPLKEVMPMGKINVIVENFDKDLDEEETVVVQSEPEPAEEPDNKSLEITTENKGRLVEQILEQINEKDNDTLKTAVDIDWHNDDFNGKEATARETNNLRTLIQTLTKTANPLGKLLNYLHEDFDAMQNELESWVSMKKQLFAEITKQKKLNLELNKPLLLQLQHLNHDLRKMEEEIVHARSNILRNDARLKELLSK